jgi:hypothetical protein
VRKAMAETLDGVHLLVVEKKPLSIFHDVGDIVA